MSPGECFDEPAEEAFGLHSHSDQLDVKVQQGIRWNCRRRALRSISKMWWDHKLSLASDAHPTDPLLPAPDHLTLAKRERYRKIQLVRGVKDLTVLEAACVVHGDSRTVQCLLELLARHVDVSIHEAG